MMPIEKLHEQSRKMKVALGKVVFEKYRLRLFVTGITPRSSQAIFQITQICESRLRNHYSLDVVDIYQQPKLAKEEDIVAAPTLIKYKPLPLRRLVGNMSDVPRILHALGLEPA